jgi:hemerythrin
VSEKVLDNQNAVFIGFLNEIHAAIESGYARGAAGPLLRTVADNIGEHLASMDAMVTFTRIPALDEHRAKQRELARQLREFAGRIERGDPNAHTELLNMVSKSLDGQTGKVTQELAGAVHQPAVD